MSRSGYSDDIDDNWELIRWRGAVASAIRGRRGQAFLRELLADLDAMPEKKLVAHDLVREDGSCCALGCIAQARGVDVSDLNLVDGDEYGHLSTHGVADRLGIARALAQEIVFVNDELNGYWMQNCTDEKRWEVVRQWVADQIVEKNDTRVLTDQK